MTTKDKIKVLIEANKKIAVVIGALPHLCDYEDKQGNADILAEASNAVQDVINALCDELPDYITEPGKLTYDGQPVNLCTKETTLCAKETTK